MFPPEVEDGSRGPRLSWGFDRRPPENVTHTLPIPGGFGTMAWELLAAEASVVITMGKHGCRTWLGKGEEHLVEVLSVRPCGKPFHGRYLDICRDLEPLVLSCPGDHPGN